LSAEALAKADSYFCLLLRLTSINALKFETISKGKNQERGQRVAAVIEGEKL
jgi:hypothetical protein